MMERETREKYGVRDKKREGVRQGGLVGVGVLRGGLCTTGTERIFLFFQFFSIYELF